jgi:hypothetical protein
MDVVRINELFIAVAVLFGGTLGMPPLPADPFMDGVAPEQCIVYSSWNGRAVPSSDSDNETERMLAEPEIQAFVKHVEQMMGAAMAADAEGNEESELLAQTIADLGHMLLTQPTTMYISHVGVGPDGPAASGALVVKGDDRLAATVSRLQRQFAMGGAQGEEMDFRGAKFQRFSTSGPIPPIFVGSHMGYLIVATGDGSVNRLMSRIGQDAPDWLVNAREALPVKRRSTLSYLDAPRFRALAKQFAGPEVGAMIQMFGLDDVESIYSTSGLEGSGCVQTVRVNLARDGRLMKLMKALKPLNAEDFDNIPPDAAVAEVANVDLEAVINFIIESATLANPNAPKEIEQALQDFEKQMGFNPRRDLAESLGDGWALYTAPDTGLYTGAVLTVEVEDFEKLTGVLVTIRRLAAAMADIKTSTHTVAGVTIYSAILDEFYEFSPVSPSFCLTKKELIVALYPQAIRAHLTRPAGKNLLEVAAVEERVSADQPPLGLVYVDTKRIVELLYPFMQGGFSAMCNALQDEGIDLEPAMLPSAGAILRHVDNSVSTVSVVDDGFVIEQRQQFPGGSIGATAAFTIGVTLPAIGTAREEALRAQAANNLKQIGLAFHNYHDTFRGFPRDSYDKDGKPLLSWRVHILPYLEAQALYEQFHLDEPWDSEHNKTLIAQMPGVYKSPGSEAAAGKTVYLAPVGDNTVMPPQKAADLAQDEQNKPPVGLRIATITDGTSNTLMVVEANDPIAQSWTKPADYKVDPNKPIENLVGIRRGGFHGLFCDGSVQFISESIDLSVLTALFTRNGGEQAQF